MSLQRWEPFKEMMTLRNALDRLFEESFVRPSAYWSNIDSGLTVPVDVYQTDKDVVVKASLPGFKPEEVDISIIGDTINIKGEHREEKEEKQENYFIRERHYGDFSRTITIPVEIKSDQAEAVFENGVLTLTLPKAEEVKPRQIKIRAKSASVEGQKKNEGGKK